METIMLLQLAAEFGIYIDPGGIMSAAASLSAILFGIIFEPNG